MKNIFAIVLALALGLATTYSAQAVKPDGNLAGAQDVAWNLSASVMPAPPYGSGDIPGSDAASKLTVNQPNGNTEVTITGVMKGLNPNTTYTVYLGNGYTPYKAASILGSWQWNVIGFSYVHNINITTQNPDGTFSGTGFWPAGGESNPTYPYTDETITGQISGSSVTFTSTYLGPYGTGAVWTVTGQIQADGSLLGTTPWPWTTSAGTVTPQSGDTWFTGLFTGSVPPFTFTTDEFGAGSWHINLTDANFPGTGTYTLSVWVNGGGGTILVSDNFEVVVD